MSSERASRGAGYVGDGRRARPPGAAPISSAPAQVRERKLGDLFEYEIEHPVTIRRNQAALVPIVLREFKGRPVLLYNKQNRAENPMRCVEFENSTGLTLEGGPVTVLEGGSYVGEAMLETLKPDETRLVPFAVELGVKVLDNVESRDEHVSRVVISKGTLVAHYGAGGDHDVPARQQGPCSRRRLPRAPPRGRRLDARRAGHGPRGDGIVLAIPVRSGTERGHPVRRPQAAAARSSVMHWPTLPPASSSSGSTSAYLDAATEAVLRQALELRRKISDAEAIVRRLEAERKAIHTEQERIRENLKSLSDRASERELRERFIRTFGTQEDRIEAIGKEIEAATREAQKLRQQLADLLFKLSYDAVLEDSGRGGAAPTSRRKKPSGEEDRA